MALSRTALYKGKQAFMNITTYKNKWDFKAARALRLNDAPHLILERGSLRVSFIVVSSV